MVLIPANVSTLTGAQVVDLQKDNFRIFEDNVEQRISYFAKEDAPLSVGLLFDTSGSMRNKMRQATAAAAALFKTANPEDEFFLVEFSEKPKLVIPFSTVDEVLKKIPRLRPLGRTSLLDAIQMGLTQMKKARHSRRALVILSDGADNRSRSSLKQIRNAVIESDVQIYAMGIFDDPLLVKGMAQDIHGPQLLDELAAHSGGRHFRVERVDDLPVIGARIGEELRTQYLLGYSPDGLAQDGKYHRIRLQLSVTDAKPGLRVHYRPGYYAPAR
jgi:Ca-activated chloride channel family protein